MTRHKTEKSKRRRNIQRLLTWLLFLALLWPFYILAGRALCYLALREIAELTNTRIRTGSVRFHSNGSVFIRKLSISPSDDQNSEDPMFRADEVVARFSPASFLLLSPRLKVIDVNDFVLDARYNLDEDRWNLSVLTMRPPRGSPDLMPRIRLKSGILQYSKASGSRFEVAVSLPLDAELGPDEESHKDCKFEITTAALASGDGQSTLAGSWTPGKVTLTGGIASVDVPEFEMAWIIDVMAAELMYGKGREYSLKLRVDGLRSKRNPAAPGRLALVEPASPGKSSPFASLQRFFDRYQPSGRIDIDLDASGSFNNLSESTLTGNVVCQDIAICYHKFQYAIDGIAGRIDFTGSGVDLRNLSGRHGDVRLFFNGWSRGFGPDWKYLIRITSDNMPLDNDLYDALSPRQQEFWSAFSPAGATAVDYRFSRESPTDKRKTLILEPQGAEAVYCDFLYPLKNLTGKLTFDRDKVVFSDVVSQVDDCRIALNGEVTTRGVEKPTYDLTANVKNLPLDTTLQEALPEKQRELFRQFNPSGLADGWVRFSASEQEPASFAADLSFEEASLNSERFPLPVSDISAKAIFSPGLIVIKEFTGRHNDGLLSLTGQIEPG
ncbi:MAG: translocation/assembly module TamB domain-containing protein, partial [Planctomycetota bacterium]